MKANVFSLSSIKELQKQLKEYQDSLNKKCEKFTEELAKRGVEIAKARVTTLDAIFTGELLNSIHTRKGNGGKSAVIFLLWRIQDMPHLLSLVLDNSVLREVIHIHSRRAWSGIITPERQFLRLRPENTDGSIRKMEMVFYARYAVKTVYV